MNKRILVITDQDNVFTLALEKANEIASQFDSAIEVVSFVDKRQQDVDVLKAKALLQQHVSHCFDSKLKVKLQMIVTSDMCTWTKNYCEANQIDLVIKTGHRSESLFYTPTDWQLIRKLNCSLLIISDQKWRAKPIILAALDAGSTDLRQQKIDQEVLHHAYFWAQIKDCQLHATYAMPIPAASVELGLIEVEHFERRNREKAEKILAASLLKSGIKGIEPRVEFGSPEKRIPSYANKIKADLVVLGSVGRTGLNGLLLGNTAEKVMHNLRTDLLVIKPS